MGTNKIDQNAFVIQLDIRRRFRPLISRLDHQSTRLPSRHIIGDPMHSIDDEPADKRVFPGTNDNGIVFSIYTDHIQRFFRGDAEPSPLSQCIGTDPLVTTKFAPLLIDDGTGTQRLRIMAC